MRNSILLLEEAERERETARVCVLQSTEREGEQRSEERFLSLGDSRKKRKTGESLSRV